MGRAHLASIAQEGRDAVRAPQAHSQARQITTAGAERCARRVHPRSNRPEPPKARETDPNADPDSSLSERGKPRLLNKPAIDLFSVFFNGIGQKRTHAPPQNAISIWSPRHYGRAQGAAAFRTRCVGTQAVAGKRVSTCVEQQTS